MSNVDIHEAFEEQFKVDDIEHFNNIISNKYQKRGEIYFETTLLLAQ